MDCRALIVVITLLLTTSMARKDENVKDDKDEEPLNNIGFDEMDEFQPLRFWGPHNYPNPGKQKEDCKIPDDIKENVCDPDNVFTASEIRKVAYAIEKVKDYPSMCLCGDNVFQCDEQSNSLHIGIAVFKHSAFNTTKEKFADYLRNTWNLGVCGNHLLFLVATEDKEMQILWGRRGADLFLRKFRDSIQKDFLHLLATDSVFNAFNTVLEKLYTNLIQNHY